MKALTQRTFYGITATAKANAQAVAVALPLLSAVSFICPGCAQAMINDRLKEYESTLKPLLGTATKEDIVRRYGAPQDRQTAGSLEVWTYHLSYGVRGGAYVATPSQYGGFATTNSYEIYDRLTLMFNSTGYLDSYKVWVQR